ncbi:MAG: hypothetical protein JW841_15215 [Deltaproteobacteria bacterium]|nr:hypothetical protein [Deltaproteobacteria bacterium]
MLRQLALFGVFALSACGAEKGASLQILDSPAPNDSCEFSADTTYYLPSGFYDPHGYGGFSQGAYSFTMRLVNNMITPSEDPATLFDRDVRSSTNDVNIIGFNMCWDLASNYERYGSANNGTPFKCNELPQDQKSFIASAANIAAGGGKLAVTVLVLDLEALQAPGIYGSGFFPAAIAEAPKQTTSTNQLPFSLPLTVSTNYWGDFPLTGSDRILLLTQAIGKNQSGDPVSSNWFLFPVDICVGCIINDCGASPTYVNDCGDGTSAYEGSVIDLTNSCLPAQRVKTPKCVKIECST